MSNFVISLDLELFWGVADSRTLASYRKNIEGVWSAVPRMLALFRQYHVHVTWAAVGMLMCRDYNQWREVRPTILPNYKRTHCSTYDLDTFAQEYQKLFFARPLVEQILSTPGQELATHTYSHFYCGEDGATPEQFAADLFCAQSIASEVGVKLRSLVFPRNQVRKEFLPLLSNAGIQAYRGNPDHWLYRDGHVTPGGIIGRAIRFSDAWFEMTGDHMARVEMIDGLVNVPASFFVRPWLPRLASLEPLRLERLKRVMNTAARLGGTCHLWWHPHNFGVNVDQNLAILESLLEHFIVLRNQYGISSLSMAEVAELARKNPSYVEHS